MIQRDEVLGIADVMVVAMSREIRDGDLVGVGLGTPMAVAAALLARSTHAPGAHVLVGGALDPAVDLATCLRGASAVSGRTPGYVSHFESMDMAERQAMTLQFLRPAEVDGHGNLNTSRVGPANAPTVRFPGGLATGDVPTLLPRIVVYLPQHRRRSLPERVSCVTGSGRGWDGDAYRARGCVLLVTDRAVVAFDRSGATLHSVHPGVARADVVDDTGFTLRVGANSTTTALPDHAERKALARIDPDGIRARELGRRPQAVGSAQAMSAETPSSHSDGPRDSRKAET